MPSSTPIRPSESSIKRLLKRIDMCTELSFEQTPIRNANTKRKTIRMLTSTMSSGITLLSNDDQTCFSDLTVIDDTILSLDQTYGNKKNTFNCTTSTSSWQIIDSVHDVSDFSVISINQSNLSQAVIIDKRPTKTSMRLASLLARVLKSSTSKSPATSVKYVNRCVRDIDRTNNGFAKEWVLLSNFV